MDDILHAKVVVINTLVDLQKNNADTLKAALANLFTIPVILFNKAYDTFVANISSDSDAYDNWVTLQSHIYTDLGPDRQRLVQSSCDMIVEVVSGTPGGDTGDLAVEDNLSYRIALLIRLFACDVKFNETPPEPPQKAKA